MKLDPSKVAHDRANLRHQIDRLTRRVHLLIGLLLLVTILLVVSLVFMATSLLSFKRVIGDIVYTNVDQALFRYDTVAR